MGLGVGGCVWVCGGGTCRPLHIRYSLAANNTTIDGQVVCSIGPVKSRFPHNDGKSASYDSFGDPQSSYLC